MWFHESSNPSPRCLDGRERDDFRMAGKLDGRHVKMRIGWQPCGRKILDELSIGSMITRYILEIPLQHHD